MFEDLVQIRFLFAFQNYVQQEKEVGSEVMGLWVMWLLVMWSLKFLWNSTENFSDISLIFHWNFNGIYHWYFTEISLTFHWKINVHWNYFSDISLLIRVPLQFTEISLKFQWYFTHIFSREIKQLHYLTITVTTCKGGGGGQNIIGKKWPAGHNIMTPPTLFMLFLCTMINCFFFSCYYTKIQTFNQI